MVKNGYKYFIGYKDNDKIIRICIKLSKIIRYARKSVEAGFISLLIKDNDLLKEKYL